MKPISKALSAAKELTSEIKNRNFFALLMMVTIL